MSFPLEKGDSLLLINVHLINFEWRISAYQTQLEQIFSFVENHQGPHGWGFRDAAHGFPYHEQMLNDLTCWLDRKSVV